MAQIVKNTAFSPYVTGPLLLLLAGAPASIRDPVLLRIPIKYHATIIKSLKWLFALGLLRKANRVLSDWADNKWLWNDDKSVWDWKKEVAVITGGSNGIGAKVVRNLVAKGIKVAVVDVEPLSDELRGWANISYFHCDITSRDAVHKAAEEIRAALGPPSILINNAGVGIASNILDATPEGLRKIFDINLISQWYTVQEFLPDMLAKKKGHIMTTASMAAFVGIAGTANYCCTKAGLLAFYESLNQELKHRYNCPQIKTSIVFPGWTRTRLTSSIEPDLKAAGEPPLMSPQTVADAMARQILAAKSGQIILGPKGAPVLRGLPSWMQERARDKTAEHVKVNASSAVS
ncbi:NAD(P)-binding protein [Mytilinidion resinicola]|uniref:Short-chain dehydrogenase/reductase 3 n=1 Tax=Mytilinidion resinicola TaxID=574789 RepID=A0A6A6YWQ4_9PEZI|nr:NAD(P)-binding protein [Mytilinidion resinicola]KAF2812337.1 NAD(P)-binding protein [Mytilinidion resinicola]